MATAPRDNNRIPTLLAASNADGSTPVIAWADPTTHRLLVDVALSSVVDMTAVVDGAVVNAADKGILVLGTDGSNYQILSVNSSGQVAVNVQNSVAVTGTFWQATQPVSLASVPSHAVTNAGTFATQATLQTGTAEIGNVKNSGTFVVQATLAAETTKVIGTVNVAAAQTIATTNAGTFAVQESGSALTSLQLIDNAISGAGFNITQFAGAAVPIGAGLETTAVRVTLPTDGTGVVKLGSGTNGIGKLTANSGVDIGDVDVTSISAGTNLIGDVDVAPRTTGGWSVGNFTSGDTYTALTNSAQVIKASAGKFGGYYIYNPNTAATYVLVYNIAAASVTVGTSTALLVFCIPASSAANLEILAGIPFGTAMSIAAATTGGGNGAPATALEAMVWYK